MRRPALAPWRSPAPGRPAVPLPPAPMPLLRGGRPLKRWRYVGCYGAEIMLCATRVRVGPLPVEWWAVWDRSAGKLVEGRTGVWLAPGRVDVADQDVRIALAVEESRDVAVETVSPHGRQYIQTRKQGGVRVHGTVAIGAREHLVDDRGVVDDSAGYHARHTAWRWSTGVGVATSGARVAWNLVSGIHDGVAASERTVWVDGRAHEVGPVTFAAGLDGVAFAEGGALAFAAEATRTHRERRLIVASAYEQPFGTFSGTLPGAGELRAGWGVMERHDVRW